MDLITNFLRNFELNKHDETTLRCIYVVGPPGSGKTSFVYKTLRTLRYDVINYSASDVRNKPIMENINLSHTSGTNIISLFRKCETKLAIVMDDIECMNNGDKGGINSLIKLIRPKKTKKQKGEITTLIPVICIGAPRTDKKMKELMKCCLVIEIPIPSRIDMLAACRTHLPAKPHLHDALATYAGSDYKKIITMSDLLRRVDVPVHSFAVTQCNEDVKQMTVRIMNESPELSVHSELCEADRTIISLLWHENVADILDKLPNSWELYTELLQILCFVDYIDRITFQKQIWVLNELSSILKTFSATQLLRSKTQLPLKDARFTKVLTKYSTEYNNKVFILRICQELSMEKHEFFSKLAGLRVRHMTDVAAMLGITVVDVSRAYRYMESVGYIM